MKDYKKFILRILPIVIILILTIGLSQIFFINIIKSEEKDCWEELIISRDDAIVGISSNLNSNTTILDMAADAIIINANLKDEKNVLNYLAGVQKKTIYDRIDIIFADGTVLVQSVGEYATDNGKERYHELIEKGSHVSQRVTDFLTNNQSVRVFSPVYNEENEPVAVLGATIYCSTIEKLFYDTYYGDDANVFVVDLRDGKFVLDTRSNSLGSIYEMKDAKVTEEYQSFDFVSAIMNKGLGNVEFFSEDNEKITHMVFAPISETGFSLGIIVDDDIVFASVNELKDRIMSVGLVEIFLLLVLSVWLYVIIGTSTRNKSRAQEAENELLRQKEKELEDQYATAAKQREFLEVMAINLPGGYHRCTTDHTFRLSFISNSFTQITGYTMEQLRDELDYSYMGIVAPEDREYFLSLAPQLEENGFINCAYRMQRRDGSIRWVQDSTQFVERDGEQYYQCALFDIHDVIVKQEELARQANMLDTLEANMPGGYHRCDGAEGWPFLYISHSFEDITGWTRDEIKTEFGNLLINMVISEDLPLCAGIVDEIQKKGYSNAMYRLKKKDGGYIWVSDSTMRVDHKDGSFFHGVLADITAQVEDLEIAKQEAEASSQAKSTFLFNISHDIRTPMNAIKGFSHIIEENAHNPQLVTQTIKKIEQAGDSLMMLMNDVLDISRIERGKEDVDLKPMNLYEHGKSLYEMFASDMEASGINFVSGGDSLDDFVYCDQLKLTRIMMNMLSNAKKFTPEGGTVTFGGTRVKQDEKTCTYRFFVHDTGIGMSPEFLKRAFEQFERERTSTESGILGSGLGLAIIKMLVELMGGTVEIKSELGKGTEISATLTFLLANEKTELKADDQNENMLNMVGKRVLLVEDNDFNREIAKYVLENMQFLVDEAENGAVCIEKIIASDAGYYDLVLMDIQMPVMDGYTATTEIRNFTDKEKSQIPIVAMTANAFDEDKRKSLKVGMNDHIAKPIDINVLKQVLSQIL